MYQILRRDAYKSLRTHEHFSETLIISSLLAALQRRTHEISNTHYIPNILLRRYTILPTEVPSNKHRGYSV